MKHNEVVQQEFGRQARAFQASPALSAAEVTESVAEALGPKVERVLDVACGPGVLLPALATRAKTVVGVDLTQKSLLLARDVDTDSSVHLVRALAEQLPFRSAQPAASAPADASGPFDAAVLRLALHHFVEPAAVLASLRPLLRPGGRLVVLDVLGPEDPAVAELRNALERLRDPSHTSLLSRTSMLEELRTAGFSLCGERSWSQEREFSEWARIISEPRRMADLKLVLRALCSRGDPSGLSLREQGEELWFTYDWGLFVAELA